MVRAGIIGSNQDEKQLCVAETSSEVYIYNINSALDNTSPQFV